MGTFDDADFSHLGLDPAPESVDSALSEVLDTHTAAPEPEAVALDEPDYYAIKAAKQGAALTPEEIAVVKAHKAAQRAEEKAQQALAAARQEYMRRVRQTSPETLRRIAMDLLAKAEVEKNEEKAQQLTLDAAKHLEYVSQRYAARKRKATADKIKAAQAEAEKSKE